MFRSVHYPLVVLCSLSASQVMADTAKIPPGSEMPGLFASKLKALGGDPMDSRLVCFGVSRKLNGVTISSDLSFSINGINHS